MRAGWRRGGGGRAVGMLVVALAATAAWGQLEATRRALSGRVTAPDDSPVADASVRLEPQAGEPGAPASTRTDASGRWRLAGLLPGRYAIAIEAPGFIPATGWVAVAPSGRVESVEVELRRLSEGTPRFSEGSPSTLARWIEKGNAALAQGRTAEARREFEKAIAVLPLAERPQVLQALARTYYLEGDAEGALEVLTTALRIAPKEDALRALYAGVLRELGRGDQAPQLLAEIEAAGPPDQAPTGARAPRAPALERRPVESPRPGRTGFYRTRFTDQHPLSAPETYRQRYAMSREELERIDPTGGAYDPATESYEVFVPEQPPAGGYALLVWISPTPFGGFTKEEIRQLLSDRGVIWIGADNSGNGRWAWYRVALALDAVANMGRLYELDPERIYVSGYSGGGRLASSMSLLYPEVFRGGLFHYGCDWFEKLRVPDKPGAHWPPRFPRPPDLERRKRDTRLVFLTGELDFNRSQTKATWRAARAHGFAHAVYLEIPGADHYHGVDREWLGRALEALDGAPRQSDDLS